jgi:hypothetical protein
VHRVRRALAVVARQRVRERQPGGERAHRDSDQQQGPWPIGSGTPELNARVAGHRACITQRSPRVDRARAVA